MKCFAQIVSLGLDPAGKDFNYASKEFRLDKGDATFVDVIHTDADLAGTFRAVGDVDFYPNGGKVQPRCTAANGKFLFSAYKVFMGDDGGVGMGKEGFEASSSLSQLFQHLHLLFN